MNYQMAPIGGLFDVTNGATPQSGVPAFWNGDIPWVTPADLGKARSNTINEGEKFITQSGLESCGTQLVSAGSLILSIRAPIGHIAIAEREMCFNQGCRALTPRRGMTTKFAFWALIDAAPKLQQAGQGTTFMELARSKLRSIQIPFPDLPSQKRIADFLDRETGRIDGLIVKKERLLEVLQENLLSSLERLISPEAPSHDVMIPFRWVCRITEGQVDPTDPEWSNKPLIAPNHIQSKTGRLAELETAAEQGAISGKYAFPAGTVLYSKIRPNLAKACIAPVEGMCSADMYPILPDRRLRPQFLLMQLLSKKFTDWATLESMRVAMPKINRETLGGYRLWVPPVETQDEAAQQFFTKKLRNEALSDKVRESIARLREHRTALITAAVTGQLDVTNYGKANHGVEGVDQVFEEAIR